jgi:hypothetical protein
LGLEKIRTDLKHFRTTFYFRGGSVVTASMTRVKLVATCYIINAASLLDEGLDAYIRAHHPHDWNKRMDLNGKIKLLKAHGALKSASSLHAIRKARKSYAHQPGQYGDLAELDRTLDTIESKLAHLGVI